MRAAPSSLASKIVPSSPTESETRLRGGKTRGLLQRFDLDPFGTGYFHGPWQTGPGDNHFGIHFSRNVKMRVKGLEEIKPSNFGKDD